MVNLIIFIKQGISMLSYLKIPAIIPMHAQNRKDDVQNKKTHFSALNFAPYAALEITINNGETNLLLPTSHENR